MEVGWGLRLDGEEVGLLGVHPGHLTVWPGKMQLGRRYQCVVGPSLAMPVSGYDAESLLGRSGWLTRRIYLLICSGTKYDELTERFTSAPFAKHSPGQAFHAMSCCAKLYHATWGLGAEFGSPKHAVLQRPTMEAPDASERHDWGIVGPYDPRGTTQGVPGRA